LRRVYNIGNHTPVELMEVVRLLEQALGRTAPKEMLPMQPGDVQATCANVDALQEAVGFAPNTPVAEGVKRFIEWYRVYHRV
jgi:UDP-glucuronate 4-epimerase